MNGSKTSALGAQFALDHKGMRVDYTGMLSQCQKSLRGGVNAEMLRQLQGHIEEMAGVFTLVKFRQLINGIFYKPKDTKCNHCIFLAA